MALTGTPRTAQDTALTPTRPRARSMPNPYEAPGCQETNHPDERFFLFPAYRVWRAPQSVACADLISMGRCQPSAAAPHTY
jgi:hypothetical protein